MTEPGQSLTVTFQFAGSDANVASEAAGAAGSVVVGAALGATSADGSSLGFAIGNKVGKKISVPYFAVDGVEHAGAWDAPTQVETTPGAHHVEVYTRMKKGLKNKARKGKADFTLSDGDSARMHVKFDQYTTTTEVSIPGQADIRSRRLHL
jgi:hypothetical protein